MKIYKIPDGKPENKFAFNGEPKNAEFALKIVSDAHEYWKGLLQKENTDGLSWYGHIKNHCFISVIMIIDISIDFSVNTSLNNASSVDNDKVQSILSESLPLAEPSPLLPEGKLI